MITIKNLKNPSNNVIFVSGIDTNIGKTIATAALANTYKSMGYNTITQKMIQTGCVGESEDIVKHRELMDIPMQNVDLDKTTCPIILSYPASPHLSAELDKRKIDVDVINYATNKLESVYDLVLLEGAGGLMVPVISNTQNKGNNQLGGYLTIDFIKENNFPVILVTCGKLGSLNHTLLSIDACIKRGIKIEAIVYNMHPKSDEIITQSSLEYLKELNIPLVILEEIK